MARNPVRSRREAEEGLTPDQRIIREAKDRLKRIVDWESNFRTLFLEDIKFANADSNNGWQWPQELRREREDNQRPALTINKTSQHVKMITNDARQNKPSIKAKPAGRGASFEAATALEAWFRNIEYRSAAQSIYDRCVESQSEGGIAYFRINTKYESDDSFDQEIFIDPLPDTLKVYLDPDIKMPDGSDARYGFVVDEYPTDEFEKMFPQDDDVAGAGTGLSDVDDWMNGDNTRVAEYYRINIKNDELVWLADDQGNETTFYSSEIPDKFRTMFTANKDDPDKVRKRKVQRRQLQWFKIGGGRILDRRDLPGPYVPICRVVGRERVIEGRLERKGIVRDLKDPQRMYNYNSSGQVEFGALQTKTPWTLPKEAIKGNETMWNQANIKNFPYLTWNHLDSEGNPIPPPQRNDAPGSSPAFLDGMKVAAAEMEMVTGQYPAQMGQPSNERTGKAIAERQRQADTATYDFVDNLALAIRYGAKIIIEWIPTYYDTRRTIQVMGLDGEQQELIVDPDAKVPFQELAKAESGAVAIMNPKIGRYEVQADVGPAFSTQRQEAWNAFVQIVTGAPALIDEIGDIMFQAADFPLADKIAERIKRKIKATAPWLLDDEAASPVIQGLQQKFQLAQQQIGELLEQLAEARLKRVSREQLRDIQAYEAETKRLTAATNAEPETSRLSPELHARLEAIIRQTLDNMSGEDISVIVDAQQQGPGQVAAGGQMGGVAPPMPGQMGGVAPPVPHEMGSLASSRGIPSHLKPRRAKDGNDYIPDPERPGKWLKVHRDEPLGINVTGVE